MNIHDRINKIVTIEDIDKQLLIAKKYAINLRNKSKNNLLTLEEKLAFHEKFKEADLTVRQLRRVSFDIEDALNAGQPANSVKVN